MSMHMGSFGSEDYQQKKMMLTMSSTTRRSSSNKLEGPRPAALNVSKSSSKITKKRVGGVADDNLRKRSRSPVVIYLVSPKIIHVRPEEFMGLVQRLTGKQATSSSEAANSSSSCSEILENNKYPISGTTSHHEAAAVNYSDNQEALSISSPPSNLAALCIDICANWDDFI